MAKYGGVFVLDVSAGFSDLPRYKKPGRAHFLEYGNDGYWYIKQYTETNLPTETWRVQSNALTADDLLYAAKSWQCQLSSGWRDSRFMGVKDPDQEYFIPFQPQGILNLLARFFGQGPPLPRLPSSSSSNESLLIQIGQYGRSYGRRELQALERKR